MYAALPQGLPATCSLECVEGCSGSCPDECTNYKVDKRREELTIQVSASKPPVRKTFFVNRFNGSDAFAGTREKPWKTIARAQAQLRYLRVTNPLEPDGTRLPEPVQVCIKELDPDQAESSYFGRTFYH